MVSILDNWIDGILIVTQDGQWVQNNEIAQRICDRIAEDHPYIGQVPQEIWQACQVLLQSRNASPAYPVIAESELKLPHSHDHFRIRASWLNTNDHDEPYILIVLENQRNSKHNLALTESLRYDLSPREADVWILFRIGYTYQEIAEELYIALNTVKKHMKNAHAKQQHAEMGEDAFMGSLAS